MKGKLIVIEGIDGSGKSTQLALLAKLLKRRGLKTRYIHIPQHGRRSAAMVDDYLNGKYSKVDPRVASLFYAIDRFDAGFAIRRWLNEGYVVLCDRWVTANAGHQGGKIKSRPMRLKLFKWLQELEYEICKIPQPDLTLIMNMPATVAGGLIGKKKKSDANRSYLKSGRDVHEKDPIHLRNAEKAFLEVPRIFKKVKIIDCAVKAKPLTIPEIGQKVWHEVKKVI